MVVDGTVVVVVVVMVVVVVDVVVVVVDVVVVVVSGVGGRVGVGIGVVGGGLMMSSSGGTGLILPGGCEGGEADAMLEVDAMLTGGIKGSGGIVDWLNPSLPQQCIWPDMCRPQV